MAIPQQKFREIVFQVLYSLDMGPSEEEELISLLMKELAVTKKTVREALSRAHEILLKQSEIDTLIRKVAISYAFERIQTIERNVLRLGIYEMLFDDNIPPKVAIAEAIRLSRKFSTPESAFFINALMDNLYKMRQGEEVDPKQLSDAYQTMVQTEGKTPPPDATKKKKNPDPE